MRNRTMTKHGSVCLFFIEETLSNKNEENKVEITNTNVVYFIWEFIAIVSFTYHCELSVDSERLFFWLSIYSAGFRIIGH